VLCVLRNLLRCPWRRGSHKRLCVGVQANEGITAARPALLPRARFVDAFRGLALSFPLSVSVSVSVPLARTQLHLFALRLFCRPSVAAAVAAAAAAQRRLPRFAGIARIARIAAAFVLERLPALVAVGQILGIQSAARATPPHRNVALR